MIWICHIPPWIIVNPLTQRFLFQGNLPESLRTRVTIPSGRRGGRKPANSEYLNSLSSMAALSNSAGLMGFPMGMPFGGLAGFGLPNPVYAAAAGFGVGATQEVSSAGKADDDSDNECADAAKDAVSVPTPSLAWPTAAGVPSYPLVYNPMMFNHVYAQNLNAANYMLPGADASYMLANSMASFASLAHAPMDGGVVATDDVPSSPVDSDDGGDAEPASELIAEDLSMKKSATPEGDTAAGNVSDSSSDSAPGGDVKDNDSSSSGSEEDVTHKVQDDSNADSATEQS